MSQAAQVHPAVADRGLFAVLEDDLEAGSEFSGRRSENGLSRTMGTSGAGSAAAFLGLAHPSQQLSAPGGGPSGAPPARVDGEISSQEIEYRDWCGGARGRGAGCGGGGGGMAFQG